MEKLTGKILPLSERKESVNFSKAKGTGEETFQLRVNLSLSPKFQGIKNYKREEDIRNIHASFTFSPKTLSHWTNCFGMVPYSFFALDDDTASR